MEAQFKHLSEEEENELSTRYVSRCKAVAAYGEYLYYCIADENHSGDHKCVKYIKNRIQKGNLK